MMGSVLLLASALHIITAECEPGKYGPWCGLTCSVHCSGTDDSCDLITGECNKCDPGYIGSKCDQERMVKRSVNLEQRDNDAAPDLRVGRERGDSRNILGDIIDRREVTDQYRKAVKAGFLSGLFS
ncbi:hypothetical protein RRG08_059837 [Elysia crispata]|uniref:Uncharacterized protein n=1 Tax=Elysia crispata TaxID=231223 RepID=A0AAE0ZCX0_9GAST|nr:hypothetical protein RRG08_059837 [Elysia crispata]